MQLTKVFTLLTGLAATVYAFVIPADNLAIAPTPCVSSTDANQCTLSIFTDRLMGRRLMGLWNNKCEHIGRVGTEEDWASFYGQWSIGGRGLKWTAELTIDGDKYGQPLGGIWYAGRYTNLDSGVRYNCNDDNKDSECTRVPFNCS
ncbi:hypothetical protein MCOR27_005183 [Pyricularia oryzae]|uniref:Uncharacterized protein n=2 Tax=Pyricularia TaxID=48558 RepID=A0ABQ8NNE9_PYRGI|nr:hypothetical protein MCOR01_000662 [Pyricularia oryzae]KAI6299720.1 hypothetical protein MCOR33_004421 [Pyricularia grisea]KAH9428575.1 hypothetical protein MCOR02_011124 [Pyricularia oryzae]KAI6262821.1 hypothetical protein MCOR19_000988 [Pyricularia oryzae]KAI6279425.1 hypothetical protein MCOR27_005183 [Pyricularia oryzae]